MTSIADGLVNIQISAESIFSTPSWFGEVVLIAAYLRKHGVLSKISEGVRFARRRFGHYDTIDQLAKRRAGLASRVRASSTNSSSPMCHTGRLRLPMWSNCICIAVPLSQYWQTRIENRSRIVGAATLPGDRSAGRRSRSGYGT